MKAEITFSQLWQHPAVLRFFFRTQSENTLNELRDSADDWIDAIDAIDYFADERDYSIEDIEEMFYDMQVEGLAKEFGITIRNYADR